VSSAPRCYVPSITAGAALVLLPEDEAHHLIRVLRLGVGDVVRVFDGTGGEWEGRLASIARARAAVAIDRPVDAVAEPPVSVRLALGILKGDQMDASIRDATMLGVREIVPVASEHVTVPSRAWRTRAPVDRWQRIAVASAKQCGRAVVPVVQPVTTFDEVLRSAGEEVMLLAAEPALDVEAADPLPRPSSALALVGPEGGWSSAELQRARDRGARTIRLGPRTLRAETTPTVLLTCLWTWWGW
jgi:16S rRNA (uracil1498-N3)-methyltransferase